MMTMMIKSPVSSVVSSSVVRECRTYINQDCRFSYQFRFNGDGVIGFDSSIHCRHTGAILDYVVRDGIEVSEYGALCDLIAKNMAFVGAVQLDDYSSDTDDYHDDDLRPNYEIIDDGDRTIIRPHP